MENHVARQGRERGSSRWRSLGWPAVIAVGCCFLWPDVAAAQGSEDAGGDKKEEKGVSLGDLFGKVKEIKVPDSISGLPEQLKQLNDAYLEQAETIEALRLEVSALREEVEALKSSRADGGMASGAPPGEYLTQGLAVTSEQLVSAFTTDRAAAEERFKDRYLKLTGPIARMESGTGSITLFIRGRSDKMLVECIFPRDAGFHVDVLTNQGRIVSRNDRRTLLSVGQPVTVTGTCVGADLDIVMQNCRVEGLNEMRKPEPAAKK